MFEGLFTVIAINGDFPDVLDLETDSLRFDGLNWSDAVKLVELCFNQNFECVLWKQGSAQEGS